MPGWTQAEALSYYGEAPVGQHPAQSAGSCLRTIRPFNMPLGLAAYSILGSLAVIKKSDCFAGRKVRFA